MCILHKLPIQSKKTNILFMPEQLLRLEFSRPSCVNNKTIICYKYKCATINDGLFQRFLSSFTTVENSSPHCLVCNKRCTGKYRTAKSTRAWC